MVLTATVTRIDGKDGNPLYDSKFSDWDKKQLQHYQERIESLKKAITKI